MGHDPAHRHRLQATDDGTITDARAALGATLLSPSSTATSIGAFADGAVLADRYRLVRFLAGGGMGEVYEADDTLVAERVALKILRPELSGKPHAKERFADEIRLARKVTHPNVCRVFDVGVDGDRLFFTMELHTGGTLAERMKREPLDLGGARPLIKQLLAGVAAAHAADVVHADLKPSNVLLAGRGGDRVVITDFGLAVPCCAELGCRCASPHLVGTPAYMAPEQVAGGESSERTDLFAVGVILFEMLTGSLPFRGATPLEMAEARLLSVPPAPSAVCSDVDATWDSIILACLARDPARRPRSAAALAAELGLA